MVAEIEKYRWCAVKAGRKALRAYGAGTTLTNDDADAESWLALVECAKSKTFDPKKGSFGVYLKRAAWNAVRKMCERQWAGRQPKPESDPETFAASLLADDEKQRALSEIVDESEALRKRIKRTRRVWLTCPQIAERLKISERKARRMCEAATIPAVQLDGQWVAPLREVVRWRHERIRDALQRDGYRRVALMFQCSKFLVRFIKLTSRRENLSEPTGGHFEETVG